VLELVDSRDLEIFSDYKLKNNKSVFTDKEFVEITNKCQTMAQAAKMLGMAYSAL
jgi:hypothetical protein